MRVLAVATGWESLSTSKTYDCPLYRTRSRGDARARVKGELAGVAVVAIRAEQTTLVALKKDPLAHRPCHSVDRHHLVDRSARRAIVDDAADATLIFF